MLNRLVKPMYQVYVPAVRPIQARAAYCVTDQSAQGVNPRPLTRGSSSGGATADWTGVYLHESKIPLSSGDDAKVTWLGYEGGKAPTGGRWSDGNRWAGNGTGGGGASPLAPRPSTRTTCYPAIKGVAGSPARVDTIGTRGWGSGARSIRPLPDSGSFEGTVPPAGSAVQFGLAPASFDHTYVSMTHSIVARPGSWSVVESGVDVASGVLASAPEGVRLRITRTDGSVAYFADDELLYTSAKRTLSKLYGATLLYSLADYVDAPAIYSTPAPIRLDLRVPAFRLLAMDVGSNRGMITLPLFSLYARLAPAPARMGFNLRLPAFRLAAANNHLGLGYLRLPATTLRGRLSRPERAVSQITLLVPPPVLSAVSIGGQAVSCTLPIGPYRLAAADATYSFLRVNLPGIVQFGAVAPYLPRGGMDGYDGLGAVAGGWMYSAALMLTMDSVEVGGGATVIVAVSLEAADALEVADTSDLSALVLLLAEERLAVNSSAANARREALQYAVNVATGALSLYEGFGFHGFTSTDAETYAYRPDGLYRVGAATDNGELIRALVDLGTDDYGANTVKHMDQAYIGVRTDGQCFVRVKADDGRERVYRVRNDQNVRRATLAKGVSGRYWSVQLEIVGASFAEVDSVELLIGATQRRGFGARN